MTDKPQKEWKFKSLTPEDVYSKTMAAYERIRLATFALKSPDYDDSYDHGPFHVIEDAQRELSDIFEDIESPLRNQ